MKNIVRSAFLLLAFLLAAEAFAEPIGRLPAFSRSLAWDNESKLLAAPLALEGFALARLPSEASPEMDVRHFPDWPSLAALPAGEGRFLLAGRFGLITQNDGCWWHCCSRRQSSASPSQWLSPPERRRPFHGRVNRLSFSLRSSTSSCSGDRSKRNSGGVGTFLIRSESG